MDARSIKEDFNETLEGVDASEMKIYISETFDRINIMENLGDTFFIYDPNGDLPPERQMPFVTIVIGDNYDSVSKLDQPGDYRLNIGLTKATYTTRFGNPPTQRDEHGVLDTGYDYAERDRLIPHPVYASQYWVSVVTPSPATVDVVLPMIAEAYEFAARKYDNWRAKQHS